jgi:hypothetical protein
MSTARWSKACWGKKAENAEIGRKKHKEKTNKEDREESRESCLRPPAGVAASSRRLSAATPPADKRTTPVFLSSFFGRLLCDYCGQCPGSVRWSAGAMVRRRCRCAQPPATRCDPIRGSKTGIPSLNSVFSLRSLRPISAFAETGGLAPAARPNPNFAARPLLQASGRASARQDDFPGLLFCLSLRFLRPILPCPPTAESERP